MSILRFVKDYWYIPVLGVAVVVGLFWTRRFNPKKFLDLLGIELAAIEAKRETRDFKLQYGAEKAKQRVIQKYNLKRMELDSATRARVEELENDPEQLAKVLERLTRAGPRTGPRTGS